MAKNVRKVLTWKPTSKGNTNPGAVLFGMINGPGSTVDKQKPPMAVAAEASSTVIVRVEKEIVQAQYFAVKNTLTA